MQPDDDLEDRIRALQQPIFFGISWGDRVPSWAEMADALERQRLELVKMGPSVESRLLHVRMREHLDRLRREKPHGFEAYAVRLFLFLKGDLPAPMSHFQEEDRSAAYFVDSLADALEQEHARTCRLLPSLAGILDLLAELLERVQDETGSGRAADLGPGLRPAPEPEDGAPGANQNEGRADE